MEAMTLEQVRDWLRESETLCGRYEPEKAPQYKHMADAVDAHLAQPAQAVDVGAAAKRLGAHLFHEHALLLTYPALCKALDISLAESPEDAFVKELLRVNDQLTRALSVEKAGPVGDGVLAQLVRASTNVLNAKMKMDDSSGPALVYAAQAYEQSLQALGASISLAERSADAS